MTFDVQAVRAQFPALHQEIHGKPLVYLDNGASAHKPQVVIDAIVEAYSRSYSNVHRGVHTLSQRATAAYEAARTSVQRYLNAETEESVVFTRGTTEGINLVAGTWGLSQLKAGDEIVLTRLEHHSNIVPWQLLAARTGAVLKVVEFDERGDITVDAFARVISDRTRIVSFAHVSNALGTVLPVAGVVELAHAVGAKVIIDGAQAVPHGPVDVQALGVDFYSFSAHKVYGPTGIGVLYGRPELLAQMPPWQGGGDMIETVTMEASTWAAPPARFEAGTPNIVGAIGLGAALEYVMALDLPGMAAHEADLLAYGTEKLSEIAGLRLIGQARERHAILSFVIDGVHPHDIGAILDRQGIAVRSGHHCAQPVMDRFEVGATTRASLAMYNTRQEIDVLTEGLTTVMELIR